MPLQRLRGSGPSCVLGWPDERPTTTAPAAHQHVERRPGRLSTRHRQVPDCVPEARATHVGRVPSSRRHYAPCTLRGLAQVTQLTERSAATCHRSVSSAGSEVAGGIGAHGHLERSSPATWERTPLSVRRAVGHLGSPGVVICGITRRPNATEVGRGPWGDAGGLCAEDTWRSLVRTIGRQAACVRGATAEGLWSLDERSVHRGLAPHLGFRVNLGP